MSKTVFLDASVLFAAAYSSTGSARDLIRLAAQERVRVLVSQDVLAEVERNLGRKAPEVLIAYRQLMFLIDAEVVPDPSPKEIHQAEAYVAQKDAMIVAAAISSRPDYLVTYDRKHLLDPPEVAERSGLEIVTPDVVVQVVREEEGDENEK